MMVAWLPGEYNPGKEEFSVAVKMLISQAWYTHSRAVANNCKCSETHKALVGPGLYLVGRE